VPANTQVPVGIPGCDVFRFWWWELESSRPHNLMVAPAREGRRWAQVMLGDLEKWRSWRLPPRWLLNVGRAGGFTLLMTKKPRGRTCIFTIAAKNYLHFVRTLMDGVEQLAPDADRFLVLCDELDDSLRADAVPRHSARRARHSGTGVIRLSVQEGKSVGRARHRRRCGLHGSVGSRPNPVCASVRVRTRRDPNQLFACRGRRGHACSPHLPGSTLNV
jgi:hypothetical protein